MLEYNDKYKVLLCPLHKCAVVDPDKHLRECHAITGKEKDILVQQWQDLNIVTPDDQPVPTNGKAPRDWLASPE